MRYLLEDIKVNSSFVSILVLTVYRFGNFVHYSIKIPGIRQIFKLLYSILDLFIVKGLAGSEIPAKCRIGKGLILPHPTGIIIHEDAVIGENVYMLHQVTLGMNSPKSPNHGAPILQDSVKIGAGAKIIGKVTLGEGAKVGANAVVMQDVPQFRTAVGIPARIVSKKQADKAII